MYIEKYVEVDNIIAPLLKCDEVLKMHNFLQHGNTSTYEHCYNVASICYKINKKFHLVKDEKKLIRAAFLHDFFLYDWHKCKFCNLKNLHGFAHAKIAAQNAKKILNMDDETIDIIRTHMWPLNITIVPKSKEAWLVCMVDKYVSLREILAQG